MSKEIEERMREKFNDIDIKGCDFTSHTPDGDITDFNGIIVKFNMSTANSVNPQFFDALREEGLEIFNVIVAGLFVEFTLYYERTDDESGCKTHSCDTCGTLEPDEHCPGCTHYPSKSCHWTPRK